MIYGLSMISDCRFFSMRFFPNFLTMVSMSCGLYSMKATLLSQWKLAAILIVWAAVCDCFDGKIARMLRCDNFFGAQLDSLVDFLSFGVAPTFLIYCYKCQYMGLTGLVLAFIIVMAVAFRLAKFNVNTIQETFIAKSGNQKKKSVFLGIPVPVTAILCIMPIILGVNFVFLSDIMLHKYFFIPYILCIAVMTNGSFPTPSLKYISLKSGPLAFCVYSVLVLTAIKPWIVIPVMTVIYLIIACYIIINHYINFHQ